MIELRAEMKLLQLDAKLPYRKRTTDAGYDVASIEDIIIPAHGTANISTGLAIAVPPGYYYTVDGRSSMSQNGIIPFRGTIDSTFNGPLMVALMNISDKDYYIKKGDRIAQIVAHQQIDMDFCLIKEFSSEYDQRGQAGWGSSGR